MRRQRADVSRGIGEQLAVSRPWHVICRHGDRSVTNIDDARGHRRSVRMCVKYRTQAAPLVDAAVAKQRDSEDSACLKPARNSLAVDGVDGHPRTPAPLRSACAALCMLQLTLCVRPSVGCVSCVAPPLTNVAEVPSSHIIGHVRNDCFRNRRIQVSTPKTLMLLMSP